MKKKLVIMLLAVSLVSTFVCACGDKGSDDITYETSESASEDEKEESSEVIENSFEEPAEIETSETSQYEEETKSCLLDLTLLGKSFSEVYTNEEDFVLLEEQNVIETKDSEGFVTPRYALTYALKDYSNGLGITYACFTNTENNYKAISDLKFSYYKINNIEASAIFQVRDEDGYFSDFTWDMIIGKFGNPITTVESDNYTYNVFDFEEDFYAISKNQKDLDAYHFFVCKKEDVGCVSPLIATELGIESFTKDNGVYSASTNDIFKEEMSDENMQFVIGNKLFTTKLGSKKWDVFADSIHYDENNLMHVTNPKFNYSNSHYNFSFYGLNSNTCSNSLFYADTDSELCNIVKDTNEYTIYYFSQDTNLYGNQSACVLYMKDWDIYIETKKIVKDETDENIKYIIELAEFLPENMSVETIE